MPFDSKLPRYSDAFGNALRDAQEILGRTVCEATGENFLDQPALPPLPLVVKAYRESMAFHMATTAKAREDAKAEHEANQRGGHAAEILSPKGEHLGYTIYEEPKTPVII